MSAKRALIVDDSRSARVILSRMLEGYGLVVDAVESAEQALEYLKETKPDVVFMDHLMPGMDGFQAIQAIKSNPQTATIPVMMYTSQEGELYLSQARALGAVGVLPKTVKQTELSRVLYQLRLLPERRDPRIVVATAEAGPPAVSVKDPAAQVKEAAAVAVDPPPRLAVGEIETAIRHAIGPALEEQNAEIKRFVSANLETLARRLQADLSPPPIEAPQPPAPQSRTMSWPLAAAIAAIALLPTVVLGVLYTRTLQFATQMTETNARLAALVEEQQSQLAAVRAHLQRTAANESTPEAATAGNLVESEPVPYGEAPLAGSRLDRLRDLVGRLRAQGFQGRVRVTTYVGDFCLTGNGIEGYSVAADDLPMKRCDHVGNPFDDSLSPAQRQSLAFANLVATIKQQTGDTLSIEVAHVGRRPAVPYPEGESRSNATAGEWNRIAAQNNRVEFVAIPTI
jgi:CheY-like chemotaxis protein